MYTVVLRQQKPFLMPTVLHMGGGPYLDLAEEPGSIYHSDKMLFWDGYRPAIF